MRAVFDTNVLLSGLLWRGPPHSLLERVRALKLTLVSSPALFAELSDVISRPKFAGILRRSHTDSDEVLNSVRRLAEFFDPPAPTARISRDPDDDAVLALAAAAGADMIVSGDADLCVLGNFGGASIVTPAEALVILEAGRNDAIQADG